MTSRITIRTAASLFAVLLATGSTRAQAPPPGSGSFDLEGFVRVIDGDTLEAYINGRQSGIGIIGIRVPMGNTPCGKAASNLLESAISRGLRLEEDLNIPYDARKRRMYYVKLPNGRSAAVEMAFAGFALPTGQGIEAEEIAAAAADAAANHRGCVRP